jgi:hypothetical protein
MTAPIRRRGSRALSVPAADGYHFGDDHEWGAKEQSSLIGLLKKARKKLDDEQADEQAAD